MASNNFNNIGSAVQVDVVEGDVRIETHIKNINKYLHVTVKPISQPDPICFQNINSDPSFTGRSSELALLDKNCQTSPNITVVYGLGGIGKTQLVRKYVDNEKCKCPQNVIWIHSNVRESIEADFESLAKECLNIPITNTDGVKKDFNSIFSEVLNRLCKLPTLIVLDNVDEEKIQKFVLEFVLGIGSSGPHRPHYVITSRIQSWKPKSVRVMKLRGFNDDEAIELVTNTLNDDEFVHNDAPEDIVKLVAKLQNFPLALRQATAHINYQREERKFYISDYIDEYNSLKQMYLDSEYFKEEIFFKYKETTYTTWRITIAAIERDGLTGNLALRILRIIAYFDADHIRRDIFFNLKSTSHSDKIDATHLISAVRLLVRYSMIESRENQSILSIHRLVQEVVRIDLENVSNMSVTVLRDGLHILLEMYDRQDFQYALDHGISVFLSALTVESLVREFSLFPSKILQELNESVKRQRAKSFGDQILPHLTVILGEDHPDVNTTKFHVAYCYGELNKSVEALQMFLEVYAKRTSILGLDHPETITTKSNIADTYFKLCRHTEALRTFQEVYEERSNILGVDHLDTITSKYQIAFSHLELGQYTEALPMFHEVYEKEKRLLGENHKRPMRTKFQIDYANHEWNRNTMALQFYEQGLEKLTNMRGENHSDTITLRSNIAESYHNLGKHTEALQMFQDVYEKRMCILGKDHPDTIMTRSTIAKLYRQQGRHSLALPMFQEVYERQREIFGDDHPHTMKSKLELSKYAVEL